MNLRTLTLLCLLILATTVIAQEKCATVEVQETKRKQSIVRESDDDFEQWIKAKRQLRSSRINSSGIYTIPVVVHVIHKGEAVGTGANISDAQIASQIKVLNRDFTRTNNDASSTPTEFASVAGSMNINFVLAKQDANGKPTSGIVRVKGTKSQWTTSDETTLKALSYWPAEDYLNIWVTDLSSSLLGYSQFPVSSLAGLESAVDNRLTDGVVIDYTVFGSSDDGSFNLDSSFPKGRTTTHEVGHFLGLRHIWGDDNGSCAGDGDYVADTPNQGNNTSGCPSHPQTSCSVHTMFQNYMDYTNDVCMNLFTQGQVDRMITVIENSPRRASLLESNGAEDPAPVPNDLAVLSIISPTSNACSGDVTPVLSVSNKGTNPITSAAFKVTVNSTVRNMTIQFPEPLAVGTSTSLSLNAVSLAAGDNSLSVEVSATNGLADGKASDNAAQRTTYTPFNSALPLLERFPAIPTTWHMPASQSLSWQVTTATKESSSNTALYLNFYNSSATGSSVIFSPVFSLAGSSVPYLIFDLGYAQRVSSIADGLKIVVVDGCGDDYTTGETVLNLNGKDLATTSIISTAFTPKSDTEWRHQVVDLSTFKGKGDFRIAFVGTNAGGNNLFIDNVQVVNSVSENVALTAASNPSPVQCDNNSGARLRIKNKGSTLLSTLKVTSKVNDGVAELKTFTDLNIAPGNEGEIVFNSLALSDGTNKLAFSVKEPNTLFDVDPSDNELITYSVVSHSTDHLPLRQNFDNDFSAWSNVTPSGGPAFSVANTNYGSSMVFAGTDAHGGDNWLVGPSLDLTGVVNASVFFDFALAKTDAGAASQESDVLKVFVSTDCGDTYSTLVFSENYSFASAAQSPPVTEQQWSRRFIDLSSFAGMTDIRVAFVYKGSGKNDFYFDNVEFYLSNDSQPLAVNSGYAVYGTDPSGSNDFYITFNLDNRQPVRYSLVDMNGKAILTETLDEVLNQTFRVEPKISAGLYILKVQIGDTLTTSRLYLNNTAN